VEDDVLGNASITTATMLEMSSFVNGAFVHRHFSVAGEVKLLLGGVFFLLLRFVGQKGAKDLRCIVDPLWLLISFLIQL